VTARALSCGAALGIGTVVAALPLCHVLFDCGCDWRWAGGIAHCNVWNETGPRCPWCLHPRTFELSLAAMLAAQGLGAWVVARRRRGLLAPLVGAALGGAAAALVARSIVAWWSGYEMVHVSPL
jgi:hypothetical protein